MQKTIVVMTATVTPASGIGNSVRMDPQLRLDEYLRAFRYYAALSDELVSGIVLLENSGCSFAAFEKAAAEAGPGKQFVFLSTRADYPAEKGKGYGEFFMLDQGVAHLRQLGLPGDTRLWKVTGRLIVKNMAAVLRAAPAAFDLYADFRHLPLVGRRLGGNHWLETRLLACTLDGYERYLRGHYGDGYVIEQAFHDRLYPLARSDRRIVPRFRLDVRFDGFSGYSNKSYSSPEYRLKGAIRSFTRTVMPFLWL
jgi:hypothetical protein